MPSRFAFGSSTNASARLLALLRVMLRLCSISVWEVDRPGGAAASLQFVQAMDCADGGRDADGVCVGECVPVPKIHSRASFAKAFVRPADPPSCGNENKPSRTAQTRAPVQP